VGDVATTKLLENDKVIVWELVLEPGESTGVHTHEHDYMVHVIEGATLRACDGDGENVKDVPLKDNDTFYFAVQDGAALGGELETTTTHDAKNMGPGRYREIMVEVK
jgi:beta-alanine degradation protein BauB